MIQGSVRYVTYKYKSFQKKIKGILFERINSPLIYFFLNLDFHKLSFPKKKLSMFIM